MRQLRAVVPIEPMGVLLLGRRSLVYALGGLAYKGVALLALPIMARLLTPAELGLLDLAAVLASIVAVSAALGTDQGVAYLEPRSSREAGVWASALVLIGVVAGSFVLVALIAGASLAEWITGNPEDGRVILAAALYGLVAALTTTALNAIRLHATATAYAVASFMIVTVEMAAALTIAWRFDAPVALMVLAWAGGALVVVVPLLVRYIPDVAAPRAYTVRRLAVFGGPLVPASVAWLVGDTWIRVMLAQGGELSALGEYGIGHRIASVLLLGVTGFGVAWQPYIFRSAPEDVQGRGAGVLTYLILSLGLGGTVLTGLAPEVIALIAGAAYQEAQQVVAPLSVGAIALGAFVLLSAVVGASGSTGRIALAAVAGMGVQFVAAPILIGTYGLAGAGLASAVGCIAAVGVLVHHERGMLNGGHGTLAALAVGFAVSGVAAAGVAHGWPIGWRVVLLVAWAVMTPLVALLVRRRQLSSGGRR